MAQGGEFQGQTVSKRAGSSPERVGVIVIHGVGETEAGWMNDALIPRLQSQPDSPAFENHSEVYDLPDRGRNRPNLRFKAFVRRGETPAGDNVALMEMTWADLSRIGTGTLANALVMLKLFYEAPQVLGECFFDKTRNVFATVLWNLIRLANWILRWPITGLNIVALVCALALLLRQRMLETPDLQPLFLFSLPQVMTALLALLAVVSVIFARWRVYRDIALTDIGMSTAMFAALSAAAILVTQHVMPADVLMNPAIYLMAAGVVIFGFWLIWNYAMLIAILSLGALAIQQWFERDKTERVPVIRPVAAVSLSVAQGVIYKIVIALLWIFIFVTHDLRITLLSDYRVVLLRGAMQSIVTRNDEERRVAERIGRLDGIMVEMRNRLRAGERLTEHELVERLRHASEGERPAGLEPFEQLRHSIEAATAPPQP